MPLSHSFAILVGADVLPNPNSGVSGTVIETNRALGALGNEVDAFWADTLKRRIRHGNLHYILELPRAYRRVVKAMIARKHYDVIQLSQPYSYSVGRAIRGTRRRPLFIWRSHGLEAKVEAAVGRFAGQTAKGGRAVARRLVAGLTWRAQEQAVRWADGTIVPCNDDRDFLVEKLGASPARVAVIWHGVPAEYLQADTSSEASRWSSLLHISQLSSNKGGEIAVDVANHALVAVPEATMTWICPEERHSWLQERLLPSVLDRVSIHPWLERSELRRIYDQHGVFVYPTLAEGAAKVVMEAMARGMCVVSSDNSGPADYICDGRNGRLTRTGDMNQMILAVEELLRTPDEVQRLGVAARETAKTFSWERCAKQMIEFYSRLLSLRGVREC